MTTAISRKTQRGGTLQKLTRSTKHRQHLYITAPPNETFYHNLDARGKMD
jgi:hypothetical protein